MGRLGKLCVTAIAASMACAAVTVVANRTQQAASAAPAAPAPRRVAPPLGARPVGRSTFWQIPAPDGSVFTLEKYDAPGPGRHPTVVYFPGTGGWATGHEIAGSIYAAHGFTGISLCWFRTPAVPDRGHLACPDAPTKWGVARRGLPDMDALLTGIKRLPGVDPDRVALVGSSRGGGEVLLIATQGGREPVVAISPLVDPGTFFGTSPSETNVITRAGGIRAPVFLAYGVDDTFVPWQVNAVPMAGAIRAAGRAPAPELVGYRGGHAPEMIDDPGWGTAPDAWRLFGDELAFLRSSFARGRSS